MEFYGNKKRAFRWHTESSMETTATNECWMESQMNQNNFCLAEEMNTNQKHVDQTKDQSVLWFFEW
jgi:hypothetical protein